MKVRFTDGVERPVVALLVEDPATLAVSVVSVPPTRPVTHILSDAFDITQCPIVDPELFPRP